MTAPVLDQPAVQAPKTPQITSAQMREKLWSVDDFREHLAQTEPLHSVDFDTSAPQIRFKLEATDDGIDASSAHAYVLIGKEGEDIQEYPLTRDALLEATSVCGLPKKYTLRTPAHLIEPQLNYWFREGLPSKEFQALVVGDGDDAHVAAITKGTVTPFSNVQLLDNVIDQISGRYSASDLLVDYKFQHSLRRTNFFLIIPESVRTLVDTGTDNDTWSAGISIQNSLTGLQQTELSGYLFRWWCTNGAIDVRNKSNTWSRKVSQDPDEVFAWAKSTVDEILDGLDHSFEAVQAMAQTSVSGEVVDVVRDVFAHYRVPAMLRSRVIDKLVEEDNLTLYAVQQAITQVANQSDLGFNHVQSLLRIGGDLPHTAHDRCDSCHRILTV